MKKSHDHTQLKRLAAISLVMVMCLSVVPFMAPSAAAAEGETIPLYVWDGEGATELASEAANWYQDIDGIITNDVLPTNNSHIRYDATSTKNCTWDLAYPAFVFYSLTLATGYTGTLTQGDVDIGIGAGGFEQESGVFTANKERNIVLGLNANLTKTGGTFDTDKAMLIASGGNTIIGEFGFRSLTVKGVVQCASSSIMYLYLAVDVDGVLNIGSSSGITLVSYNDPSPFVNLGTINGPGKLFIRFNNQDENFALGNISAPVELILVGGAVSSCKYILPVDTILGSSLYITAWDPSKTMTIDLNGHSLTANSIRVGTRGAIVGDGTVYTSAWDSTSGELLSSTNVILRDGGTVKLAPGQAFDRLEIASDDGRTASWSMTATGTVSPIVTGLESGMSYRWYLDGVEQGEVKADKDGTIALSYVSTGLHTLSVGPGPMTEAMDGLYSALPLVISLAVLVGVLGMVGTLFGRIKF